MFVIFFPFIYYTTSHLGHIRVHIFNRPISNEPTKSLGIKLSTFQELLTDWSIYLSVLHMFGWSKMKWKATWHLKNCEYYVLGCTSFFFLRFVSEVDGFLWALLFPPSVNWPPRYSWNIVESGIKHHNPNFNLYAFGLVTRPWHTNATYINLHNAGKKNYVLFV